MPEDWRTFILEGFYPYFLVELNTTWLPSPSLKEKVSEDMANTEQCCITLPKSVTQAERSPLAEKDIHEVLGHMRSIIHDFQCGTSMEDLANQHGMTVASIEEVIRFAMELK